MARTIATLGDLADQGWIEFGDGYRTKQSELGTPGLPILRVAEVLDGRISPNYADFVREAFRRAMGSKVSQAGDLVLTTKGTVGRVAMIPASAPQFVYSPQVCYFRTRRADSPLDMRYFYYWLKSPSFKRQIAALKSQTDMADYINLADLRSLRVDIPALRDQVAAADVLGAFDDKITINERITQATDQLRSLLLDQFLETPGNSIRRPLSALADFVNGRAFTKNATGTGRMVVRIADINSGPGPSTVYSDIDVPDVHVVRPGEVLFAWSGSLTVARWYRPEAIVNQHIFKVIPRDGWPAWVLYEMLLAALPRFRSIAADKATTMGHIQRHHLDEPVLAPKLELLGDLDEHLGCLWDRALAAERESLALAELRDTLLPGLMSGEIRVRDAEKVAEDVL